MSRGRVFKRGKSWSYTVDIGSGGDRRQRWRGGFRTKRDAVQALTELQSSVDRGTFIEDSRMTLRQFLQEEWLPAIQTTVRASTLASYEHHVRRHIVPRVGGHRLQKLTPRHITGLYADLLGTGLAPGTVRKTHTVLRKALRDAERWGHIRTNAAANADPPKQPGPGATTVTAWTLAELDRFLEGAQRERFYPLWHLLASTGMRRGEAAGLRWEDVDLAAKRLSVRQARVAIGNEVRVGEPKTPRSRRSVALDDETVAVLEAWRERQDDERHAAGVAWAATGLVFTTEDGSGIHPDRITKAFQLAVRGLRLRRIRLHDLRHTHATLALQAGVHPKVVSERLGHSSISLTLDTYSHAIPAMQADAAETIARLRRASRQEPPEGRP